jgi:hypothetical protein
MTEYTYEIIINGLCRLCDVVSVSSQYIDWNNDNDPPTINITYGTYHLIKTSKKCFLSILKFNN